jgi:hypothetical protein
MFFTNIENLKIWENSFQGLENLGKFLFSVSVLVDWGLL